MNKKKLLAGVLSLAMAFSTLPSLGAVSAVSFAAEPTAAATGEDTEAEDNTVVIDNLTYKVYADHAEFIKCDDTVNGDVVIAGEVAGVPVTRINGRVFSFCSGVTSVKIPATVTNIGDHLAGYAKELAKYTVDEKNETFCAVDGVVYTKDMKKLVAYPSAYPTTDFTVPSSVEIIGDGAAYTANIENLIIPDSVTAVEDFAFTYCKSLKSVKLPSGLKSIGYSSFGKTALESVELPPVLEVMDSNAFDGCRQLKSVTVTNPATVIKDGAIPANEGLVIRGYEGSTAQTYAEENNIAFEKITGGSLSTTPTKVTTTTTTTTTTTAETTTTTTATSTATATTTASTTSTSATTTTASTTTTPPVTSELTLAERVVGTWNFKEFVDENGAPIEDLMNTNATVSFNSDGTGYMEVISTEVENEKSTLTWSIDDNKVKVSQPGYAENEFTWFSLSEDGFLQGIRSDGLLIFERVKDAVDLGDANGDGSVDAKDASFILVAYAKASTGSEDGLTDTQREAADVNTDGKVDAKDASAILAYYAYLSTGGSNDLVTFLKK
ncbi:MAG: leucine-rich repeat protein [Ruminococcus sp.]|nr:leucine-rich repeat protein [Ruminococcus sp.]